MFEIECYLNHYKAVCPEITEDEREYISKALSLTHMKDKEYYLKSGQIQHSIGFIAKGLIRVYCINDRGNEITTWFAKENDYVTDYPSFVKQRPTKFYFQCLEPTSVVNLPYDDMQTAYQKYKNIERYGRLFTEEVLDLQQSRIESFLFQNAEERYLAFVRKNPNLFSRLSLTDLSTYLGIERQSLSRIRKMLSQK